MRACLHILMTAVFVCLLYQYSKQSINIVNKEFYCVDTTHLPINCLNLESRFSSVYSMINYREIIKKGAYHCSDRQAYMLQIREQTTVGSLPYSNHRVKTFISQLHSAFLHDDLYTRQIMYNGVIGLGYLMGSNRSIFFGVSLCISKPSCLSASSL